MIDFDTLQRCYDEDRVYALQLEIWDSCEQACDYCYMKAGRLPRASLDSETLRHVVRDASTLAISRIEWLGGEPLLRADWRELLAAASQHGIVNNLWTGGLPLADESVARDVVAATENGLVAFHISSVDEETYARLHSRAPDGQLRTLLKGVENILAAGKPPELLLNSVTFTRGQSVADMVKAIDFFKDRYAIATCVNLYQSYKPLAPSTHGYLDVMPDRREGRIELEHAAARSGAAQAIANCVNKQYCSATVAVTNEGKLTPCATIRPKNAPSILEDGLAPTLNRHKREMLLLDMKDEANLPEGCTHCAQHESCWGCRGRAWDCFDSINARDPACFRNPANRR